MMIAVKKNKFIVRHLLQFSAHFGSPLRLARLPPPLVLLHIIM